MKTQLLLKTKLLFLTLSCLLFLAATGFTQQPEGERKAGDRMVLTINNVEYAFRWCPPGTFMMGSPANEPGRTHDENQRQAIGINFYQVVEGQRQVTLSHGFWMLETEVTYAMWESIMGRHRNSGFGRVRLPVDHVSWYDCQEYIKKLNELLADIPGAPAVFKFSLPTEAQWEYACRAGTTTAFAFGDTLSREQANFGNSGHRLEVGSFPANAWGLHDMHGNVLEWCLDWYGDYPIGAVADPVGAPQGWARVIRGGSNGSPAGGCRSASRSNNGPTHRNSNVGLRLALVRAE